MHRACIYIHTHAWKMLCAACTEVTSWWWTCLFGTYRG